MVRQGAPLVRLDQTQTGAEFGSNSAQFDALRMRIARLEGELSGRTPVFPVGSPMAAEQAQIERSLYASRMADLMTAADLAITAGGLTLFELACVGTPALVVCAERWGVETAERLAREGAAMHLGFGGDLDYGTVPRAVDLLSRAPDQRAALAERFRTRTRRAVRAAPRRDPRVER